MKLYDNYYTITAWSIKSNHRTLVSSTNFGIIAWYHWVVLKFSYNYAYPKIVIVDVKGI